MRFNSKAYDKVFPRQTEVHEQVETAVETFRPSEEPEEDVSVPEKVVEEPEPVVEEQGGDDDGSVGELDSE